jgi:hypothetical protein
MNRRTAKAFLPRQMRIKSAWVLITFGLYGCYQEDNYMRTSDSPILPESDTIKDSHNISNDPAPSEKTGSQIIDDYRSPVRSSQNSDAQVSPTIGRVTSSIESRKLKQHRAWGDPKLAKKEELIPLEEFLESKGAQLNCWFTLEDRYGNADQPSTLMAADVVSGDVQTIDDLVTKLRNDLEEVHVVVVHQNDNVTVIHLIELALVTLDNYAINKNVTISHTGRLCNLVNALHERFPGIGRERGGAFPRVEDDTQTLSTVSVIEESVRTTLTIAAPLPNYGRIIWRARTDSRITPSTEIKYLGLDSDI